MEKELCALILEYRIELDVLNKRLDLATLATNYRPDVISSLISRRDTLVEVIAQIKHILKIN